MNKCNKKVVPLQPPQHVLSYLCKMKKQSGHAAVSMNWTDSVEWCVNLSNSTFYALLQALTR